jgi:tetratricopeptide (TPR) repeat protein
MKKRTTTIVAMAVLAVMAIAALSYHLAARGKHASAETEEAFASANRAVTEENYTEAIAGFSSLIESGQHGAATYYNLALAHHRAGNFGDAIVNYERAASLDPRATDIRANLGRARKDSATVEAPAPTREKLAKSLSTNGWNAMAASGFFALGLLAVGRTTRLLDWPKNAMRSAVAIAIAALAIPLAALVVQHEANADRAIVTGADTSLRVSPFDLAKPVTSLAPGKAVRILPEQHGDYHLAQLETGQKGWVKRTEFGFPNITAK